MSDPDIVIRLRLYANASIDGSWASVFRADLNIAADEIKRLRAERDEVRKSYCSLMEAYRGGDGRVTANKLGWGYLFEEDKPCQ